MSEMSNATHFNHNRLCAVEIKTTGPNYLVNSIYEICIFPMTSSFQLSREITPYFLEMAPTDKSSDVDFSYIPKDDYYRLKETGMPKSAAMDLFLQWYYKLNIPDNKCIIPLTYDWGFIRPFLVEWLGLENFTYRFSHEYRDLMPVALFQNDYADIHVEQTPIPKVDIAYICSSMKVEYRKHYDCINHVASFVNCYNRLLSTFLPSM